MAKSIVAIPVRNEAERIGPCLEALNTQIHRPDGVVVLLNNCTDSTEAIARGLAPHLGFPLEVVGRDLPAAEANAGHARRLAMQLAAELAGDDGVLLTTDADSIAPPDWVARNVRALGKRADIVCGRAALDAITAMEINLRRLAPGHTADLFDRVQAVAFEEPVPNFLHSALCAMSLPVRRPTDETAPIIRRDGQYTLAITPRPVLQRIDGQQQMSILGVPYGSLPRLVLIHIMTEAVRTRTRHIVLGSSFTDWMRRMGFRSISYGPRGSATLIRQQLDRLLACEWMIRWDNKNAKGDQEFAVKEVKLTNEYAGTTARYGGFSREILLTEGFFDHLREHAVPLDENAVRQIRDSATSLDLYTWLSYRLPRINKTRPTLISWPQLAVHFGNEGNNIRKFRQTIRDAWERQVSAVYPEARAEFDTTAIRLYASPAPLARRPLRLVTGTALVERPEIPTADDGAVPPDFLSTLREVLGATHAKHWLEDAAMEDHPDGPALCTGSKFKADYIRRTFTLEISRAASACGLAASPPIIARHPLS